MQRTPGASIDYSQIGTLKKQTPPINRREYKALYTPGAWKALSQRTRTGGVNLPASSLH
jgi:hypothetical protein